MTKHISATFYTPHVLTSLPLVNSFIFYSIVGTYLFYILGLQALIGPAICWGLGLYSLFQWSNNRLKLHSPILIWLFCSIGLIASIIVSHAEFNLGISATIKSILINWTRGWALFPMAFIAGALPFDVKRIYKATCILALISVILIPFFYLGSILHLPSYVSPIYKIFKGSEEPFRVIISSVTETGTVGDGFRFQLFAPWAPALGLIASLMFFLCQSCEQKTWKYIGMICSSIIVSVSGSRLGWVCTPLVFFVLFAAKNIRNPKLLFGCSACFLFVGIFGESILNQLLTWKQQLDDVRADSSLVRERLYDLGIFYWQHYGFWWGNAQLEDNGFKFTQGMRIGTHHTWVGLLYLRGLIGCLSIALAFASTIFYLTFKVFRFPKLQIFSTALSLFLVLLIYSIGENLDTLTYLIWPSLLVIGKSLNQSN